ncbi:MAG TPA: hypothetical protein VFY14_22780, partial [Streptomyces sp.]|nr:hypothetical protein [Streptomyces sp.]
MDPLVPALLAVWLGYCTLCAVAAARCPDDAPLWLRWPSVVWDSLLHGPRPVPIAPRPDYRRIEELERELGIGKPEPEPARPIRLGRTVCLTKDCDGDTEEIQTWGGQLAFRIHHCWKPA